jgi:hypothetical protein
MALLGAVSFQAAQAEEGRRGRRSRGGFNLFAAQFGTLDVNRVFCGINNLGEVCVDPTNSPGVGGGFWPVGTPNQYIFNSGLQLAGIIDGPPGFVWNGDTTGVFFMDPKGTEPGGDPVTLTYNSLDPADLEAWPTQAFVRDTALYAPVLIGRKTLAQQDLWVRTWDGNPNVAGGRVHPLGVLVEERGLAWNFPSGNEDIVYFVYDFYNISATDRAAYNGLHTDVQDSVYDIAVDYVTGTEARFGIDIPAEGYTFTDFYAAFFMDPDVGTATENYSSAILPFEMALAYKRDFVEDIFTYSPDINGPPFYPAPGFVGVKYLRSPVDPITGLQIGLTMFSNTLNTSTGFPDPDGVVQMWRYISGNISVAAGDNPCDFPNPKERRLCFLYQQFEDTRFYQSSGPFDLAPGGTATIVVAYVHAAPVADALLTSGQIGGDLKPLTPYTGDSIFGGVCGRNPGNECIRPLDSVAGWLTHNDDNGNSVIEQDEVVSVPRSLLDKALVAQAVFDNKFLLPFAPEVPPFFLVPGDNTVTVVWETTPSEVTGDPFFGIASDPLSPLFDANFREFDVEGYRIYRGRVASQLVLVAEYDYAGTVFTDNWGGFAYDGNCAPELGITTDCPTFPNDVPLIDDVAQVKAGSRTELADGSVFIVDADTAVTGGGNTQFAGLRDTGVPFAFVDNDVLNGFTYYYAVTAYDVNSYASGPTSLESPLVSQSTTPRSTAANKVAADDVTLELIDRDNNVLDPAAAYPTIDPATGTFSGPMPPSGAFEALGAQLFADNLVTPGLEAFVEVDSVVLFYYHDGTYYLHGTATGISSFSPGLPLGQEDGPAVMGPIEGLLEANSALADSLGLGEVPWAGKIQTQISANPVAFQSKDTDWHPQVEGAFFDVQDPPMFDANGAVDYGGSRWFDGANETMAHPTLLGGHGMLTGVTAIYSPAPFAPWENADAHTRRPMQTVYHGFRAADIQVYWGAPGVIDSVVDITHNMLMQFQPQNRVGWGFIPDASCAGCKTLVPAPDGLITYEDWPQGACFTRMGNWNQTGCETRSWEPTITAAGGLLPTDTDGDHTNGTEGSGFGLWINSEVFYFNVAAMPTNVMWTLRTYMGQVNREGGTGNYSFAPEPSNAPIPGLRIRATTGQGALYPDTATVDLDSVHTVPDPYYGGNAWEAGLAAKILKFVNLPNQAIIRIYSLSGILLSLIEHNDPTGGGEATWNLRNRNGHFVASGVYFYHVETPSGQQAVGRFTVVWSVQ